MRLIRLLPMLVVLLLPVLATTSNAQTLEDYDEYYRLVMLNALDQYVFCYPTKNPENEPSIVAVRRDSLGRPTEITRFFFGNPNTKVLPTTERIEYIANASNGNILERRTFHGAGGMPVKNGWAYGEDVLYKSDGQLLLRRKIDINGKPLADVPTTTRTMFRQESPQVYIQEWFYGKGKQHVGVGTDGPMRPFAELPELAYFRHFQVDEYGNLTAEALWSLNKEALAFPDGEYLRVYTVNDCGQPERVQFYDASRQPMANNEGIAAITYEYDNYGRIVVWRAFNVLGAPTGRKSDGAATIRYNYRAHDGVLLSQQRFNVLGEEID